MYRSCILVVDPLRAIRISIAETILAGEEKGSSGCSPGRSFFLGRMMAAPSKICCYIASGNKARGL